MWYNDGGNSGVWKILKYRLYGGPMDVRRAIRLAINNIKKESITDIDLYSDFFEIKLLRIEEIEKAIIDHIEKCFEKKDNGEYDFTKFKFRKIGNVLLPKKEFFDFRKCALIDIIDEIKYLSIVILLSQNIEISRVSKSKNIVFSYRFKPRHGYLFDSKYNFTKFREYVSKKKYNKNNKVLVEADISNFYDRLNLHRLESNLFALKNVDEPLIRLLNELLLFWSNRDSYGLPVGSNASRILAEATLIEVDDYLLSHNVDFCRFVDDYRIFACNSETAQHHLSLLVKKLNEVGLFLNSRKSRVVDVSGFKERKDIDNKSDKLLEEVNRNDEKEVDNLSFNIPRIIRGYSGVIPTKFRKLTQSEIERLKEFDINNTLKNLNNEVLLQPNEIKEFTKAIVAQKSFDNVLVYPELLLKFPQFLPFITDMLIKNQNELSEDIITSLKINFAKWFERKHMLEYILVYLTRFFNSGKFEDKETLFNYFRSLKRNSGDYIGRALLEALDGKLSRVEVLEIRNYYTRADDWEKRQILRISNKVLSKGEARAFFKDATINNNDILINYIASNKTNIRKIL